MKPVPPDFPARRDTMTLRQLQTHYQASWRTVRSWIAASGLPAKAAATRPRKPLPEDFRSIAPTMHKSALVVHYKTSQKVIDRWLCEAGISAKPVLSPYFKLIGFKADIPGAKRETAHDLAADYLRRFMAVSRCDERGRYAQGGDYFLAGARVVTFAELIEKAEKMKSRKMETV